jgi:small subunit ribosomal protein S18
MAKVFVGNFSFAVDEEKLKEYFSQVGTVVSAKVMKEGQGGRSRGFGFVEFSTPEEAAGAITKLDGSTWEGRVIKVSEDRSNRRHEQRDSAESSESNDEGGAPQRSAPMGYFKAQPLELGFRRKKKIDPFLEDTSLVIDYKDAKLLSRFVSERGRILPRRMTGLTAHNQRQVTRAIKRAQHLAIMPYTRG